MINIGRPLNEDAPPWCPYFFGLVKEDNLLDALQNNGKAVLHLINAVPANRADFAYDSGKWSVKQVFIHLTDTERFYAYRAFCSSRKVDVDLEFAPHRELYSLNANASDRTLKDIAEEFTAVRAATFQLFSNMTNEMLDFKGFPNKMVYTARSLGWMTVGHAIHHMHVVKDKYLVL